MNQRIYLRAFELNDHTLINSWRNNRNIQELTGNNFYYISSETDKAWIIEKMKFSQKEFYFAICEKESGEMIGYCSLNDVDWVNRKAIWGGIVIAEKSSGKRYGTEAVFFLLKYAFEEINLNRVHTLFIDSHERSIKIAHKLNFLKEGVYRKSLFKNGQWHNQLVMSILRDEYFELVEKIKQTGELPWLK